MLADLEQPLGKGNLIADCGLFSLDNVDEVDPDFRTR